MVRPNQERKMWVKWNNPHGDEIDERENENENEKEKSEGQNPEKQVDWTAIRRGGKTKFTLRSRSESKLLKYTGKQKSVKSQLK